MLQTMWNIKWILVFVNTLLLICLEVIEAIPTYQDNHLEDDRFSPGFLTIGQKYSYAIGSTVILPCKINETDKNIQYVLAWKRGNAVLTAGNVKVTMNPRIRLIPVHELPEINGATTKTPTGYNLELRDVRVTDAGDYACQIGTLEPQEIIHKLEVLVPPKIDFISPGGGRLDVAKGSAIRLECRGSGNPTPKIYWSRKNNLMPNSEANVTGNIFEIVHADRHSAGHYRCSADNRVVSPEIEVERAFIHTGVGYEAQLTCLVHSEPPANIVWYKDTTQLGTTEQHSLQNRGNRHSLIIRNVTYMDLGNYTCQASNNLGKDRGSLTLSGIPTVCYFDSKAISDYRDRYNITWNVQSHSPIREYRLFYRKQTSKSYMLTHQIQQHLDKSFENTVVGNQHHYSPPYSTGLSDQWENVVIPENFPEYYPAQPSTFNLNEYHYNSHINTHHHMSYLIKNLSPATNYEARVQARNDHGWNKLSNVFHFSTRSEDIELEPSHTPTVLRSAGLLDKGWLSSSASANMGKVINIYSAMLLCILLASMLKH
ncbi:CLUMA_CG001542, isoform A [Clunio marinus]|uniref:CLUMA_CG001542, isoform A n=2 Tax=Clunio marinus TaxID=568069 RepID=A0A1J1HK11_9DIPT|nr:CLUMA_CG001542, isoform A [Clunio marinus]